MTKCQLCPNDHDVRKCELVNGSHLNLCGACRRRHDAMVSMVPMTADEVEAGRDPYETPEEGETPPVVRVVHLEAVDHFHEECPSGDRGCGRCVPF